MDSDEIKELVETLELAKNQLGTINFKSRVDKRECTKVYKIINKALTIAKGLDEPMVKVED